jgi:hypothetical protein
MCDRWKRAYVRPQLTSRRGLGVFLWQKPALWTRVIRCGSNFENNHYLWVGGGGRSAKPVVPNLLSAAHNQVVRNLHVVCKVVLGCKKSLCYKELGTLSVIAFCICVIACQEPRLTPEYQNVTMVRKLQHTKPQESFHKKVSVHPNTPRLTFTAPALRHTT